jgi:hypothetical protein
MGLVMRGWARLWVVSGLITVSSVGTGSALEQLSPEQIAEIKARVDVKSLANLQKVFPELGNAAQKQGVRSRVNPQPSKKASAEATAPQSPNSTVPDQALKILVRNSWSDLGILGVCAGSNSSGSSDSSGGGNGSGGSSTNTNAAPGGSSATPNAGPGGAGVSTSAAKGASLSFTQDYVANNRIWAAQGMAAAVFSDCSNLKNLYEGRNAGVAETSIALYAQVNSSYNSNAKLASKNNLDTNTAGLSGELVYQALDGNLHVFRLTPNVTQDGIKNTTAVAVMGQYVPAFISLPGVWHPEWIFDNSIAYQFNPTLDVQYASTTDRKKPLLFSGQLQSLRIGPELALTVTPFPGEGNSFLNRIGITELFHPWYEAYSGHGSYWWANTIKYNLDDNGNFALALSYNRGLDENSGGMTNQYLLSLNGKM